MRVLILLSSVALALFAYIATVEWGTVSDVVRESRKGRVLTTFVRDRIEVLEVQHDELKVRLVRQPQDGQLAWGTWFVETPFKARADEDVVGSLLGELEWLTAKRELQGISDEDRARFGFQAPGAVVSFQMGRERGALLMGKSSPRGDGDYVSTSEQPDVAYVVGSALQDLLSGPPERFHHKELHGGLALNMVQRIALGTPMGRYQIDRRAGDLLWLTEPDGSSANPVAFQAVVGVVDGLQAKRVLALRLEQAALPSYGLTTPYLELTIDQDVVQQDWNGAIQQGHQAQISTHVRVGAPCRGHAGERYALVGTDGPLVCVDDQALAPILDALQKVRDPQCLPTSLLRAELSVLRLELGDYGLVLARQHDHFVVERSGEQFPALGEVVGVKDTQVWLDGIAAFQVVQGSDEPAGNLPGAAPGVRLTLVTKEEIEWTLLARRSPEGVWVLRDGEPRWVLLPAALWDLLHKAPGAPEAAIEVAPAARP